MGQARTDFQPAADPQVEFNLSTFLLENADAIAQAEELQPGLLGRILPIAGADGATEALSRAANSEALQSMMGGGLSGELDAETINNVTNRLGGLVAADPQIFTRFGRVMDAEGSEQFLQNVAGNEAMGAIFGAGLSESDPAAITAGVQNLEALIEADPEVFNKLNEILSAPGADDFLDRVAQNPQLQNVFNSLIAGSAGEEFSPEQATEGIDLLHAGIKENGEFFPQLNRLVDQAKPEDLARLQDKIDQEGPAAAMLQLTEGMQTMQGFEALQNVIGKFADFLDRLLPGHGIGDMIKQFAGSAAETMRDVMPDLADAREALNSFMETFTGPDVATATNNPERTPAADSPATGTPGITEVDDAHRARYGEEGGYLTQQRPAVPGLDS